MAVSVRPAIEKSGSCRGNRSYRLAEVAAYVLEEAHCPGLERAKKEEQGTGSWDRELLRVPILNDLVASVSSWAFSLCKMRSHGDFQHGNNMI